MIFRFFVLLCLLVSCISQHLGAVSGCGGGDGGGCGGNDGCGGRDGIGEVWDVDDDDGEGEEGEEDLELHKDEYLFLRLCSWCGKHGYLRKGVCANALCGHWFGRLGGRGWWNQKRGARVTFPKNAPARPPPPAPPMQPALQPPAQPALLPPLDMLVPASAAIGVFFPPVPPQPPQVPPPVPPVPVWDVEEYEAYLGQAL